MNTPIYSYLKNIKSYPFHMPGHKRNKEFLNEDIYNLDLTEIPGTDNLQNPSGIIKEALLLTACAVGADKSYYSVNGSSGAIIAAIMSCVSPGEKIITAANCHKSVYNGLIFSGANPIYISPEITEYGICGGINPETLKKALKSHNDAKAVIITSPTYEGFCTDVKKISEICHNNGKILIVDEAHGSHFCFSDYFPKSALEQNADIVIQSWHKTLPVPTQSSLIHIKGGLADYKKLETTLSMIQTSSPSYIFMSLMDKCRAMLQEDKSIMTEYTERLIELRKSILRLKRIKLIDENICGKFSVSDIDKSKLTLFINSDISGTKLENILLKEYNLQIEMSGINHAVLITSIGDVKEGFDRLKDALIKIDSSLEYKNNIINSVTISKDIYEPALNPRKSFYSKSKKIKLEESENKISAETVIPYPPGIPIISQGEIITKKAIEQIKNCIDYSIPLIGIEDNTAEKIKVITNE